VLAALAQLSPVPSSPPANARSVTETIASVDADLIVFPELFLSGYDLRNLRANRVGLDSPEIAAVRQAAAEYSTAVALGFAERRGDGASNSVLLIDERGEVAGLYRKVQLFGEEVQVFEPGEELVVATLAGRRVGALICFDMEFPELARALARAGADLLLTVAANMEPFYSDHRIAAQARALDNRLPHLYCNRCGEQAHLRFVGGTRSVLADGTVEAEIDGGQEQLLFAVPETAGAGDARVDYLALLPDQISVRATMTARGGTA
jgi:predicted amidohydrolase